MAGEELGEEAGARGPSAPTWRATRSAASGCFSSTRSRIIFSPTARPSGVLIREAKAFSSTAAPSSAPPPGRQDPGAQLGHGEAVRVDRDEAVQLPLGLVEVAGAEQDAGVEQDGVGGGILARGPRGVLPRLVDLAGGEPEPGQQLVDRRGAWASRRRVPPGSRSPAAGAPARALARRPGPGSGGRRGCRPALAVGPIKPQRLVPGRAVADVPGQAQCQLPVRPAEHGVAPEDLPEHGLGVARGGRSARGRRSPRDSPRGPRASAAAPAR